MAEANILGLSCSICLDLLKDPVTLLCGHSNCTECTKFCWNQEDQKRVYSCPQCKETFSTRPAVSKNTVPDEVVETLKKAGLQATPPAQCSAGPEDVECDFCTERKHKAIKSCLVCLASFCETHLQPHYKSPAFKKHKLVEASRRLQDQICSQHDKLMEVYCRTDQQCICILCTMDQHKGHDTVSAAAGRAEKQKQLLEMQKKSKQAIQDREKELQKMRKAVETYKHSAHTAMQESVKMFTDLTKAIEKRQHEVAQLIRDQEKAAVSRAEDVIKQLQQEIGELKKRDAELEELSPTEDPIQYLQSFQSVPAAPGSANFTSITYRFSLTFEKVLESVSQLRDKLETFFNSEFKDISPGAQSSEDAEKSVSKIAWEKKLTMEEEKKAKSLQLSPTCLCSTRRDLESDSLEELQKIEVQPGEKDEEILFKQWAKLFRWDRDLDEWKERGVGYMNILFHPVKKYYRILMRRDKTLTVCANHSITKDMEIKSMATYANALVWMAIDYAESDAKVEQLAVKFKTPKLAESFCQRCMSQVNFAQCKVMDISRPSNPVVFFTITAGSMARSQTFWPISSLKLQKTSELCALARKDLVTRMQFFTKLSPISYSVRSVVAKSF